MNRPATNQSRLSSSQLAPSQREPLRMPGQPPSVSSSPMRPLATGRPYAIRPTPTFSFTEELESARREQQRNQQRPRSGSGALLFVLMLLAGSAGYVAVKYRVWQDPGPLVERAKELVQSLRTLAPTASPDTLARPARAVPPAAAVPSPRLAPEVVPITRDPEPANAKSTTATTTERAPVTRHHSSAPHHQHAEKSATRKATDADTDPTEEELLAPSANRR